MPAHPITFLNVLEDFRRNFFILRDNEVPRTDADWDFAYFLQPQTTHIDFEHLDCKILGYWKVAPIKHSSYSVQGLVTG